MTNHHLFLPNHDLGPIQTHDFGLGQDPNIGLHHHHHENEGDPDNKLVLGPNHENLDPLTQSHQLLLLENQELVLSENSEFDDNHLALTIHPIQQVPFTPTQNRALSIHPNHDLAVGQEFPDVKACRRALRDAAIACHFEIQTVKSDKSRFTAKCASEGCPWRVHAAKLPGIPTFTIRTIHGTHACGGIAHLGHHQASVQWVANSVEDRLREDPHCKPKDILEEIHKVHGITLSYKQAWRGKERVMAAIRCSFEEGYRLLPRYCEQVRRANPGSVANVYRNPSDGCFHRLFISFHASIHGFVNACRPLLGLDRFGALLFATGFDGDGAPFPLAFGVVNEESDMNWMWFLSEMRDLLEANTENMPRLTVLSDRRKGIVEGVDACFPTAFHGFCLHHLSESFRMEFNNSGMLVSLFWEAAHAPTVLGFESKVLEIEGYSRDAARWVRGVPPRLWATAYFEGTRFGQLMVNADESVNGWVREASGLPIVQMMEHIRRQLMTWFNERREASMRWTMVLVPSAEERVLEAIERARGYTVVVANEAEFEVLASNEGPNVVDIRNRCCSCRGWQLYGLPCAHAVAVLLSCRQNVYRFTESCFTVASYRRTYSQSIHPIPDRSMWDELPGEEDIVINPPKSFTPPSRQRKKRVRAGDHEGVKRVVHCSRCNRTGHFRTTCTAPV